MYLLLCCSSRQLSDVPVNIELSLNMVCSSCQVLVTSQKRHFTMRTLYTKISKTYFRDGSSSVHRVGTALQQETEIGAQPRCLQAADKFIFQRSQQYVAVPQQHFWPFKACHRCLLIFNFILL